MRRLLLAICIAVIGTTVLANEPVLVPTRSIGVQKPREILLRFRNQTASAFSSGQPVAGFTVQRVAITEQQTWQQALLQQAERTDVTWAQPNGWRYALAVQINPNDPYYRPERNQRQYQQWHLPKINADYAWSVARGQADMIVAIVDSGVDLNHPDLKSRLLPGITLTQQDGYSPPANGMDDNGHGTMIAGIIGASSDNQLGIVGCAWQGKLLPVKVLNNKGEGTDADIAAGIVWAVNAKARIINLSVGGPDEGFGPPRILQEAIDYAYAHNCLVVAASGNSGDRTLYYPAAMPHVFSVAATDPWDQRASYSSYNSYVALAAPGGAGEGAFSKNTGILSTYWDDGSRVSDQMNGSEAGEYAISSGTSMAAAVVSGAALVVWGHRPLLSNVQLENLLKSTAHSLGAGGANEETGAGRIDLLAALDNQPIEQPELTTYNFPNPFNPGKDQKTQIVFLLSQPEAVTIKIYDAARDLVWSYSQPREQTLAGKNYIAWNGRNEQGQLVSNGAYFYQLTSGSKTGPIKIIAVLQ